MKIIVDNVIKILEADEKILEFCKKELEIENPQFEQNKRLGFPVYNIPRKLIWWERKGKELIVPFGCFQKIWQLHPRKDDFEIKIKKSEPLKYKSNIKLYDYQEKACKSILDTKNGILVMCAGSGKTQTALEAVARLGLKTLWVTHTMDLLNQSYDRAKSNLEDVDLGKIASGKIEIGEHITFATVQTLAKSNLMELKDEWDVIIGDEIHRMCGTPAQAGMFFKVFNSLSARYKIGLTATNYRNIKGTEKAMYIGIGDVFCEIPKEAVADRVVKATIKKVKTKYEINENCQKTDGTIDYSKLTSDLATNEERNKIILDLLKKEKGNYILVLGDRLTQLEYLQEQLGYGVKIDGTMVSKKNKALREQYIQDMRDGKENVLFASYGLAKEGLDITRLNRLILASPHRDKATIIQSVGRIERKFENKNMPIVYDVVDNTIFHENMWKDRKRIYKKNGNNVIEN